MLKIRKAGDRGVTRIDWLDSRHTFSFGDYYDPDHTHFRALRVINDDRIAPGGGFGSHPHRDMEILTYVLSGALAHRDSMGNGSVIKPGEWQKMSAGTGITHSEFNASDTEPVHLLQIWIVPERKGLRPNYAELPAPENAAIAGWRLVASHDGRDGSIPVNQDVMLSTARIVAGKDLKYDFVSGRDGWLHVASGEVTVNGEKLAAGDALEIENEANVTLSAGVNADVLLFDLAR